MSDQDALQNKNPQKRTDAQAICPFLGFNDDPATAISYPSNYNFCFHAKPVKTINLGHQAGFCLTSGYENCPIFQKKKLEPLPRRLWGENIERNTNLRWVPFAALIGVVILGVIAGLIFGIIPLSLPGGIGAGETQTATPKPITNAATMVEPTTTPTITINATSLPEPTETPIIPTTALPRGLETPMGDNPTLMLHRLMDGEGLNLLAQIYDTSTEAIKAVNFNLPQVLWINTVIVIPVATRDVTGVPQFSTYEVENDGTTIEELAALRQVDADLLKKYNGLPDGYVLSQGEWLLIPQ